MDICMVDRAGDDLFVGGHGCGGGRVEGPLLKHMTN
jgi:hypothetical protein